MSNGCLFMDKVVADSNQLIKHQNQQQLNKRAYIFRFFIKQNSRDEFIYSLITIHDTLSNLRTIK